MLKPTLLTLALATSLPGMALADTTLIDNFSVDGLDKTAIKRADIEPFLTQFAKHDDVTIERLGHSYLGMPIDALTLGDGPTKVMMWSQMHGDENTATAALMDFLSFTLAPENDQWRSDWMQRITLKVIPMVNPDGAAVQTRFNAQGIDLNRDAKALRTLEGQVLMNAAKSFKPEFGFNLHDQNAYYAAGKMGKPATISVLAPAYNDARDINESRGNAMKLTAQLAQTVNAHIDGHLGKYNDSYSYRSFGDTFSEMGISTILIESGAYFNDSHRQVARKVNRAMYKEAIDAIVSGDWREQAIAAYEAIPFNDSNGWVDLLIDDVQVNASHGAYQIDISVNNKSNHPRIEELGDISSIRQGYTYLDAKDLTFSVGSGYDVDTALTLDKAKYTELLKQGYTCFTGNVKAITNTSGWPTYRCDSRSVTQPMRYASARFLLSKGEVASYAVLGAHLISLK